MKTQLTYALAVLALAACSGGGDAALPPLTGATARLSVVSGNAQRDTVAQRLPAPVVVKVTDDAGRPRAGVAVAFAATDPECGRPVSPSAVTAGDGHAETEWELGTHSGYCTLEARAVDPGGATLAIDSATATALPGIVDSIRFLRNSPTFVSADGVHAVPLLIGNSYVLTHVLLRAADRYGNSVAEPHITWAYDGAGYVVDPYVTTNTEGIIRLYPAAPHNDTLYVVNLYDLTRSPWRADWTCRGGTLRSGGAALPVDSMRFALAVGNVQYGRLDGSHLRDGAPSATYEARFTGTLSFTIWWGDGSVQVNDAAAPHPLAAFTPASTTGPWSGEQRIGYQFAGGLQTLSSAASADPRWTATRLNGLLYTGGGSGWCLEGMQNDPSTFVLASY